jgi:hypothetical protein
LIASIKEFFSQFIEPGTRPDATVAKQRARVRANLPAD